MDDCDDPLRDIIDRQLVVPGAQRATLLEPTDHSLNDVPAAVGLPVEMFIARLVGPGRDDIGDVMPPQPPPHPAVTVALVSRQAPWPALPSRPAGPPGPEHNRLEGLGLVPLPRGHEHGQDYAPAVADQVDFGTETTPRAP